MNLRIQIFAPNKNIAHWKLFSALKDNFFKFLSKANSSMNKIFRWHINDDWHKLSITSLNLNNWILMSNWEW